ncbi:MAG TPA: hypothetical protein VEZ91_05530 [Kurthia gibsonii]|nr:hypothetical protein [Kurthia gibsonii]
MHDEEPECEMEEKQKNDIQYIIEKVENYCITRTKNSEEALERAVSNLIEKHSHYKE